jgi:hypothetical protein
VGGGGGSRGSGDWYGHDQGPLGAFIARRRAKRQLLHAVEADLRKRGLPIPKVPMSRGKVFAIGLCCALFLGLLIWLIVWAR